MTADVLAVAVPKDKMLLRIRVMTGDEVAISVLPTVTVAEACEIAVDKTLAARGKERTLNKDNVQLPPASRLAQHQIIDGALLHLILKPPPVPVGPGLSVPQLLAAAEAEGPGDAQFRAYGKRLGLHGIAAEEQKQAKTLYARCGGIFGVAAFVDRCMDAWMADPVLNANDAVAT